MQPHRNLSLLTTTLLTVLFTASSHAADLEAGRGYDGPQFIAIPTLSTSFSLPKGMTGKLAGEVFTMGHRTLPGLILGTARPKVSQAELLQELRGPIPLDDGVSLELKSKLVTKGDKVTGQYRGAGVVGYAVARRHKSGRAILFIAVAQTAQALKPLKAIANKMARSVKFGRPAKANKQWTTRLSGKAYKLFSTTSTTTSQKTLYLCADGRFRYRSSASGASSSYGGDGTITHGVSFAGASGSRGSWRVVNRGGKPLLTLTEESGEAFGYSVERNAKGHLLFDGQRWLRDAREEPRCD